MPCVESLVKLELVGNVIPQVCDRDGIQKPPGGTTCLALDDDGAARERAQIAVPCGEGICRAAFKDQRRGQLGLVCEGDGHRGAFGAVEPYRNVAELQPSGFFERARKTPIGVCRNINLVVLRQCVLPLNRLEHLPQTVTGGRKRSASAAEGRATVKTRMHVCCSEAVSKSESLKTITLFLAGLHISRPQGEQTCA